MCTVRGLLLSGLSWSKGSVEKKCRVKVKGFGRSSDIRRIGVCSASKAMSRLPTVAWDQCCHDQRLRRRRRRDVGRAACSDYLQSVSRWLATVGTPLSHGASTGLAAAHHHPTQFDTSLTTLTHVKWCRFPWETRLRSVACHMGSHIVTCHPT